MRSAQSQLYFELPDGRVLMRVFFGSEGEVIERPTDGLERLALVATGAKLIQIVGYTDALGDAAYNRQLGLRRASRVAQALREKGIPGDRIVVHSRGEAQFLAGNDTASGRALNRRVEVLIEPLRTP